jgi:hypothetical protein
MSYLGLKPRQSVVIPPVGAAGTLVQRVASVASALQTGTTTIPGDDTIPQNTEGDQYYSVAITPNDASNHLFVDVWMELASNSANRSMKVCLFSDASANALAVMSRQTHSTNYGQMMRMRYYMVAGGTSEITFSVRAGSGGGTTTVNGQNAARLLGGVLYSGISVSEYAA